MERAGGENSRGIVVLVIAAARRMLPAAGPSQRRRSQPRRLRHRRPRRRSISTGRWRLTAVAGGACYMNFGHMPAAARSRHDRTGRRLAPATSFTSRKWDVRARRADHPRPQKRGAGRACLRQRAFRGAPNRRRRGIAGALTIGSTPIVMGGNDDELGDFRQHGGPTDPTRAMLPFLFAASPVQAGDSVHA